MKNLYITLLLTALCCSGIQAQSYEAQELLLNWEKLKQLEQILDNMYRGYVILDKGYTTIKNIAQGNYSLHEAFLNGLMLVDPAVANYRRIPYILSYQKQLVNEYHAAYDRFRRDHNFTVDEIEYLANVYKFLFNASVRNLDDLITIITSSHLQMTDAERMEAIDRIFFDMQDKVIFLRSFNNSTELLAIQRARSRNDTETMLKLYGIN